MGCLRLDPPSAPGTGISASETRARGTRSEVATRGVTAGAFRCCLKKRGGAKFERRGGRTRAGGTRCAHYTTSIGPGIVTVRSRRAPRALHHGVLRAPRVVARVRVHERGRRRKRWRRILYRCASSPPFAALARRSSARSVASHRFLDSPPPAASRPPSPQAPAVPGQPHGRHVPRAPRAERAHRPPPPLPRRPGRADGLAADRGGDAQGVRRRAPPLRALVRARARPRGLRPPRALPPPHRLASRPRRRPPRARSHRPPGRPRHRGARPSSAR